MIPKQLKQQPDGCFNGQLYDDCQVVAAFNAWISLYHVGHYEIKRVVEDHYEELVDLAGARHGAALTIEKVHDKLGLVWGEGFKTLYNWKDAVYPGPAVFSVWHPYYGFHAVCCTDVLTECSAMRVLNFDRETTVDGGWIFRERFAPWVVEPGYGQIEFPVRVLKKKVMESE